MSWIAYADESVRFARSDRPGCYNVAALVVWSADAPSLRAEMEPLAHHRKGFHWTDASDKYRQRAVETVASAPALHVVAIATPLTNNKQERERRACLERLLFELESAGVALMYLERRTETSNRRDRAVIDGFRARHIIDGIRVEHLAPSDEPLLCVPDIVASVSGTACPSETNPHWNQLGPAIELHEVELL